MAGTHDMPMKNASSGFTLMELLMVIALLGIAFFIVVPRFEDAAASGDLNTFVRGLSARLQAQREAAVGTQEVRSLYLDLDNRTFGMGGVPLTPEEWDARENTGKEIPDTVSIMDVEWPGSVIQTRGPAQFAIAGNGYIAHAAIHLEDTDRQVTIILEPFLGQARIFDGYVSLVFE